MKSIADVLGEHDKKKLEKKSLPSWVSPMFAKLTDRRFSDPAWIFERKLDGERCLGFKKKGNVTLRSRNKKKLNMHYPELVDALQRQRVDQCVIDGEVVAFHKHVTNFSRLQQRMHVDNPEEAQASGVAIYYYIFDIIYIDGYLTTKLPLRTRKHVLKQALFFADPLRYLAHRNEVGEKYYEHACRKGWEGIIAKQADSHYVHSRSSKWLKFKCVHQQELVIGGYTEPHGERVGFGALLVGYFEGRKLRYAGKVGTGYDDATLRRLSKKLARIERKTSPFDDDISEKGVHWVRPDLVAQIAFAEWTSDNKLRHPRYQGLRRDKKPKNVTRESS